MIFRLDGEEQPDSRPAAFQDIVHVLRRNVLAVVQAFVTGRHCFDNFCVFTIPQRGVMCLSVAPSYEARPNVTYCGSFGEFFIALRLVV